MKKIFAIILAMLISVGVAQSADLELTGRAGGQVNYTNVNYGLGSSSLFSSSLDLEVVFESFPWESLNELMNFEQFSIRPYLGIKLLPANYTFYNEFNSDFAIFGGIYSGLNVFYKTEDNKDFVLSLDNHNIKVGYKMNDVTAGLVFNNYYFLRNIGVYTNYSKTILK